MINSHLYVFSDIDFGSSFIFFIIWMLLFIMAIYGDEKDIKRKEFELACAENSLKYLKQLTEFVTRSYIEELEYSRRILREINNEECPHYEYDEEFNEHYCYGGECLEKYRITCKYESEEQQME